MIEIIHKTKTRKKINDKPEEKLSHNQPNGTRVQRPTERMQFTIPLRPPWGLSIAPSWTEPASNPPLRNRYRQSDCARNPAFFFTLGCCCRCFAPLSRSHRLSPHYLSVPYTPPLFFCFFHPFYLSFLLSYIFYLLHCSYIHLYRTYNIYIHMYTQSRQTLILFMYIYCVSFCALLSFIYPLRGLKVYIYHKKKKKKKKTGRDIYIYFSFK